MCAWLPFTADSTTTDLLALLYLEVLRVSVLPICSERKKEKKKLVVAKQVQWIKEIMFGICDLCVQLSLRLDIAANAVV